MPWELIVRALRAVTDCRSVLLYVKRWLAAPLQHPDGRADGGGRAQAARRQDEDRLCKDSNRRGQHEHTSFTFLGLVFRPREARSKDGEYFKLSLEVCGGCGSAVRRRDPLRRSRACDGESCARRITVVASSDDRLSGRCLCGAVRFLVSPPFTDAGRCHCKRCQIRSGQSSSLVARVPRAALEITDGLDELRVWRPPTGNPKWFCGLCGTHVFAGELDGAGAVGLRPGTLDPTPNVDARWHIWVSSMPSWDVLPNPNDRLPRYEHGVTG